MNDRLVLVGAAPCSYADLKRLPYPESFDYMAVGMDAAEKYQGKYDYCVSLEPFDLPQFKLRRQSIGGNTNYKAFSCEPYGEWVDQVYPDLAGPSLLDLVPPKQYDEKYRKVQCYSGSSSLFGVKVGIKLGYSKIVLCGCPLDSGHYKDFQVGWLFVADLLQGRVKSMSGWTRHLFGEPTEVWLDA